MALYLCSAINMKHYTVCPPLVGIMCSISTTMSDSFNAHVRTSPLEILPTMLVAQGTLI